MDIVVAKYSSAGGFGWARRFGGLSNDYGYALAVDASDNVIMAGTFQSTVAFDTFSLSSAGSYDIALAKLSGSSGSVTWARSIGGSDIDTPGAVAVDRNGDVVLTGQFFTSINLGGGSLASAGSGDIFLAKYSGVGGSYQWGKRMGGAGGDSGQGVSTDPNTGNIVMTGGFSGTVDFGGGLRDTYSNGGIYVAGYDPLGNYLWDQVTGAGGDVGTEVKIDGSGDLAVTGKSAGGIYFGGSTYLAGNGLANFFVASFGISGNVLPTYRWAKVLGAGTNGASMGSAVGFGSSGQVLGAGSFTGTIDFGGTSATSVAGYTAGFVAEYSK